MCKTDKTCVFKSEKTIKCSIAALSVVAVGLLSLYVIKQVKVNKKENGHLVKVKYKFSKEF